MNERFKAWKVAMYGDSIVCLDGGQQPDGSRTIGYESQLQNLLGFAEVQNLGLSGAPLAMGKTDNNGIGRKIEQIYTPVDLVIIAAGTNDYRLDVPVGRVQRVGSGFDCNTTTGALQSAIEHILDVDSEQKIMLMTPLQRDRVGYTVYSDNALGHKLNDYRQAIIDVARVYAVPVWDAYCESGLNMVTLHTYTVDGLHPNNLGFARVTSALAAFIQAHY